MAKDMQPITKSDDAHISLLDLPIPILDHIILAVHQMIKYDGYFYDLRLVNQRFNNSILHCLAFRTRPRDLYAISYQFETQRFRLPKCIACGTHNMTYARTILQGRIASQNKPDSPLSTFYGILSKALATCRAGLAQSTASFQVTRAQIRDSSQRQLRSLDQTFTEPIMIMFCDAVNMLFQITGRGRPYLHLHRLEDDICHREAGFWVRNLACYLGDIELLDKQSCNQNAMDKPSKSLASEFEELLTMTASRGHEALLQHMLARTPLQHLDLAYALSGACYSGKMQILNMILSAVAAEQVAPLCSRSLLRLCRSWRCGPGFNAVAEEVIERCDGLYDDSHLNSLLVTLVDLGATQGIHSLLQRFNDRKFWPFSRVWRSQFFPLWSACINGDLGCVRSLIRGGYLSNAQCDGDVRRLCFECLEVAAYANSLSICQELCQCLGETLESMDIVFLACIEGSIDIMGKKLAADLELLDTVIGFGNTKHTVGQASLKRAAERLRVENVSFFLQQGIRSDASEIWSCFELEWRFRRVHEQEFQKVQKLLREHGVPELQVVL